MAPPLLERDGWVFKVPVSFFATGQVIQLIISVLMPGLGVSKRKEHVMPLGFIVSEGYDFGPVNMMVFIISLIAGNVMYAYYRFGFDFIPDITPEQIRNFTILFYGAFFSGIFLFIFPPPADPNIGAYQYGMHEIFGHLYMFLTCCWMLYFSQWLEKGIGRNALGVGCAIAILGQLASIAEVIGTNQKHAGKFQMLGCAVMFGCQLMLTFAAELDRFVIINAAGFVMPASYKKDGSGSAAAAAVESGTAGGKAESTEYESL